MSWAFYLTICLVQILSLANAMEDSDYTPENFLSIRLPYSVKIGEIIKVPVNVYNYLDIDLDVVIIIDNSKAKYKIIDFDNKVIPDPKPSKSIVGLGPFNTTTAYFLIIPKVNGKVKLKVNALYIGKNYTMHKTLNVVKKGVTQHFRYNRPIILGLEYKKSYKRGCGIQKNWDTEMGVVGDPKGLILNNLYNLVRIPADCGEEKMSSLLPNYFVMKKLKNSKSFTPTIKAMLLNNLEIGFLKMLKYHRMDGSFSSFDPSRDKIMPRDGSALLTSYVLRFLPKFKEFININETIIEEGLAYLSKQQAENGSFIEKGDYFYDSQRNPITVTGSAVLAFLENPAYAVKYFKNIIKGLEYIANNFKKYNYLNYLALETYALKLAEYGKKSPSKWLSNTSLDNQNKWWHYVFLSNIEISSNYLLDLLGLLSTNIDNIERVVKRQMEQHKSLFFSAGLNTIFGLTWLIDFADSNIYVPANMDLNIETKDKNIIFKLNKDTAITYKSVELNHTEFCVITANGTGAALVEVSPSYELYRNEETVGAKVILNTTKLYSNSTYFEMLVCVKYKGEEKFSNMMLLEISTPSGYVIKRESLQKMENLWTSVASKLKKSDSLVVVYFDRLFKNEETCLTVEALRTHAVVMQKPAAIQLYDYYKELQRTIVFYDVYSDLCDICITEDECTKCIKKVVGRQKKLF